MIDKPLDDSVKKSVRISELLRRISEERGEEVGAEEVEVEEEDEGDEPDKA